MGSDGTLLGAMEWNLPSRFMAASKGGAPVALSLRLGPLVGYVCGDLAHSWWLHLRAAQGSPITGVAVCRAGTATCSVALRRRYSYGASPGVGVAVTTLLTWAAPYCGDSTRALRCACIANGHAGLFEYYFPCLGGYLAHRPNITNASCTPQQSAKKANAATGGGASRHYVFAESELSAGLKLPEHMLSDTAPAPAACPGAAAPPTRAPDVHAGTLRCRGCRRGKVGTGRHAGGLEAWARGHGGAEGQAEDFAGLTHFLMKANGTASRTLTPSGLGTPAARARGAPAARCLPASSRAAWRATTVEHAQRGAPRAVRVPQLAR
jgi:hypothetical protein